MLKITTIKKGIVMDHIKAGTGIKIFNHLELDKVEYPVALIMNVESSKLGRKDIIKIEDNVSLDYTFLRLLSPTITINIVDDERIVDKIKPTLPEKVVNIISCRNPRCITTIERDIPQVFNLTSKEKGVYRCDYCYETSEFCNL
ncbi:aspartate carbamoyltransferase regulatory subunit [Clostridium sp. UBA1652]|uniref:aspartate carbamoyltransferase regulatory subunit n=1 Tax=Clostridium sp. UBA1652 TaxID=1946348 RepID=UPI00257E399C|nr:aspartate carbamoyltransferase regulatory subunit [Clostridium sp. UBA1652]